MSHSVCDYEPCLLLQKAIKKVIIVPKDSKDFNVVVLGKNKPLKTFYFPITYCPFCGTRIEEEWIESFLNHAPIKGSKSADL